jgi:hypothetical protein
MRTGSRPAPRSLVLQSIGKHRRSPKKKSSAPSGAMVIDIKAEAEQDAAPRTVPRPQVIDRLIGNAIPRAQRPEQTLNFGRCLRDDVENPMADQRAKHPLDHSQTGDAKNQLHEIADKAAGQMKDAAQQALDRVEGLTEQARLYSEQTQRVVNDFKPRIERSLKEQPMTTLAGVALVGFVLGTLWQK